VEANQHDSDIMRRVLRTVSATRYVTPLREGGSLPGLVEADDDGFYVLKFRGAGQGPKALAAEVVVGELARALGLPVPELVLIELDPELARAEPDLEIQDLIRSSGGVNLGVDFLPGSLPYASTQDVSPELAAAVVWLDALVENVDRTPRNPNLLRWHGRLWLIDHGAALWVHHRDGSPLAVAGRPFPAIREHVLLPAAGSLLEADAKLAPVAAPAAAAALLPRDWADPAPYAEHLRARLESPREWVADAERLRIEAGGDRARA
jgi:HipA-like protein